MNARIFPVPTALTWLRASLQLFGRQPIGLMSLVFFYFVFVILLSLIPLFGMVLSSLLAPGFSLAFMHACRAVQQGRRVNIQIFIEPYLTAPNQSHQTSQTPASSPPFPGPSRLTAGFNSALCKQLFILGAYALVCFFISAGCTIPFDGGKFFSLVVWDTQISEQELKQINLIQQAVIMAIIYLPFLLLYLYAPTLVGWQKATPLQSLFYSAIALWRNLGAIIFLGILFTLISFGGAILIGLFGVLLGKHATLFLLYSFGAALMSWFSCAIYISYSDIFAGHTTPVTEHGNPPT